MEKRTETETETVVARVWVGVLTSGRPYQLERALRSVARQDRAAPRGRGKMEIVPHVCVNTLDDDYAAKALAFCAEHGVEASRSDSNGRPGKGHNAVLAAFDAEQRRQRGRPFDFGCLLDGDDALYPGAVRLLAGAMLLSPPGATAPGPDRRPELLFLNGNDAATDKWAPGIAGSFEVTGTVSLRTFDELEEPWIQRKAAGSEVTNDTNDPWLRPVHECSTPARLVAFREGAAAKAEAWYCEEARLYDDYPFFVRAVEASELGLARVATVTSTSLYLYNEVLTAGGGGGGGGGGDAGSATGRFGAGDHEAETEAVRAALSAEPSPVRRCREDWRGCLSRLPHLRLHGGEGGLGLPHLPLRAKRELALREFAIPELRELHRRARVAFGRKEWAEAKRLFCQCLVAGPDVLEEHEADVCVCAGVCCGQLGDAHESILWWGRALRIRGDSAQAYFNLAMTHAKLGKPTRAIDCAERGVEALEGKEKGGRALSDADAALLPLLRRLLAELRDKAGRRISTVFATRGEDGVLRAAEGSLRPAYSSSDASASRTA